MFFFLIINVNITTLQKGRIFMKKKYHVMNQFNYYMSNLIFNILSIIMIIILYNFGFYGEQTENFLEILLSFITQSFFTPISIAFAIIIVCTLIFRSKNKNPNKDISIEIISYSFIFIPIIIALGYAMYYIWTTFTNSGWFCAFISIFYDMFIFHYLYVISFYKTIDRIFIH